MLRLPIMNAAYLRTWYIYSPAKAGIINNIIFQCFCRWKPGTVSKSEWDKQRVLHYGSGYCESQDT